MTQLLKINLSPCHKQFHVGHFFYQNHSAEGSALLLVVRGLQSECLHPVLPSRARYLLHSEAGLSTFLSKQDIICENDKYYQIYFYLMF